MAQLQEWPPGRGLGQAGATGYTERFPDGASGKIYVCMCVCICLLMQEMKEAWVQSLGLEDPLEEEMATHSSILVWRMLWTEESGWLQFMGSQRVTHDWVWTCQHQEQTEDEGQAFPLPSLHPIIRSYNPAKAMETTSQRKHLWQISIKIRLDDWSDNFQLLQKFKKGLVTVVISSFKEKFIDFTVPGHGCRMRKF